MARRRKKSKAAAAAKGREKDNSPMITEKSLPALPPNVIPNNAFSNDRVDPDSDTPTELSPRPRAGHRHTESSSRSSSRPAARSPERQAKNEGLGLSSHPYRSNRSSTMMSSETNGDDGFFIPVALDPSPGPGNNSRSGSGNVTEKKKDYFSIPKSSFHDKRTDSQGSTPHIAFQDKGRQHSSDYSSPQPGSLSRNLSKQSKQQEELSSTDEKPPKQPPRPKQAPGDFKLQDAPNTRKVATPDSSPSDYGQSPLQEARRGSENMLARKSQDSRRPEEPIRQSLDKAPPRPENTTKAITRKELPKNGTCLLFSYQERTLLISCSPNETRG